MSRSDLGKPKTPEHRAAISAGLLARGIGTQPKRCSKCNLVKDRSDFRLRTNGYSHASCRACERKAGQERYKKGDPTQQAQKNRATTLKRYHNITIEQYDAWVELQGHKCAACRGPVSGGRGMYFHVDHDHKTATIRGLLCGHCNTALGLLGDDPERVQLLLEYILNPPMREPHNAGLPSGAR